MRRSVPLVLEVLEERLTPTLYTFFNDTNAIVDGPGNNHNGTVYPSTVTIVSPVLATIAPSGETLDGVSLSIRFDKIDDPNNDRVFHNEIGYDLISPAGTAVHLIIPNVTYDINSPDVNHAVTVVFSDSAPTKVGPNVLEGTFRPEGKLSDFIGENPVGNWKLVVKDTVAADQLVHFAWTLGLEVSPVAPVVTVDNSVITFPEDQIAKNSGKFSDPNLGDKVTLSASVGTITYPSGVNSGTWSWSLGNLDGPADIMVTITARDQTGRSSNVTFQLMVNDVPPTIDISGPNSVVEGFPYQLTFGAIHDGPNDIASALIVDWGDGTQDTYLPAQPIAFHTYADGLLLRKITVYVVDEDGPHVAATKDVKVENYIPTIELMGKDSVLVGLPYELTLGSVIDPGADTVVAYTIHWGDGTTEQFNDMNPAGQVHTHIYTLAGVNRTITVDLLDDDGLHLAAGQKTIAIRKPPTITISGADLVTEGSNYVLSLGAVQNPAPGGVQSILINWGDGTEESFDPKLLPFNANHLYLDGPINNPIKVFLIDEDGTHLGATKTINVLNVKPAITLSGGDVVTANTPYELTLGEITDPGMDTVIKYAINWGDGSPADLFNGNPTGKMHKHTYLPGNFIHTIVVELIDEDGSSLPAGSKVVRFLNLSGPASVDEGASYTLDLGKVAFDPIGTWVFNWGDGTAPETFNGDPATATHIYKDEGTYTIKATAKDEEGTFDAANTLSVTVNNVPTFLTAKKVDNLWNDVDGDGQADPGDTIQYTVTITNTGPDDAIDVSLQDTPDPNTTLVPDSIMVSPLFPLTAVPPTSLQLTDAETKVLEAAKQRWLQAGLTLEQRFHLEQIQVVKNALPGEYVALNTPGFIQIDVDAAGHGWFVDATPLEDSEFANALSATRLAANTGSPAKDHLDFLTVVMQQIGRALGIGASEAPDLMQPTLVPSERHLPPMQAFDSGIAQLRAQYGFYFSGNYWLNWAGAQEKWFLDRLSQWYIITPNGNIYRWQGSLASSPLVTSVSPTVYANPDLLLKATVQLNNSQLDQLAQLRREYGFRFGGSYSENWGKLHEKWFLDRQGSWYFLTPSGDLIRWSGGSTATGSRIATISPVLYDNPQLLFQASVEWTLAEQVELASLRLTHGFRFAGSYYENWGNLKEKWLLDRQNQWVYLTPDGNVWRWLGGSMTNRSLLVSLSSVVYDDPSILFSKPAQLSANDLSQLSQLRQTHGFRYTGSYSENWGNLGEKWFLDNQNQWYFITPSGQIFRWWGSTISNRTLLTTVNPVAHKDPTFLFNSPPLVTTTPDSSGSLMNNQALEAIAAAARQRWQNSGLSSAQLAALQALAFEVADLPGLTLGLASSGKIQIDFDAAGRGWFIDNTPLDDSEFSQALAATHLRAADTSAASGRFDLLTTLLHEMGHVIGLPDYKESSAANNLMYGYLQTSERRLPSTGQANGANPGDPGGTPLVANLFMIDKLKPGQSVNVFFNVAVNSPLAPGVKEIFNQGTVRGTDSGTNKPYVATLTDDPDDPTSNTDRTKTVLADVIDLQIAMTANLVQVAPGGTLIYTLNYSNLGNAVATNIVLTILLPAGTSFNAGNSTSGWTNPAGNVFRINGGSLAPTASGSVTFALTVSPTMTIPNRFSTSASIDYDRSKGADFNPLNNQTAVIETLVDSTQGRRWR